MIHSTYLFPDRRGLMSEALISDPGSSLRRPTPGVEKAAFADTRANDFRPHGRISGMAGLRALPTVKPGQLWLVELPANSPDLSPLEHRALTQANVVIYDRSVVPTVADLLPL